MHWWGDRGAAASLRWCGQQSKGQLGRCPVGLLSLLGVMLPGGRNRRMEGGWAGAAEAELVVYTQAGSEAVLSHFHIYLSAGKAESSLEAGTGLPSAWLMNKEAELPSESPPGLPQRGEDGRPRLRSRCRTHQAASPG